MPFIQDRLGKINSEQAKMPGTKYYSIIMMASLNLWASVRLEIWPRHAQQITGRVDAMKVAYQKLETLQAEVAVSRSARLDYLYFWNLLVYDVKVHIYRSLN